MYFDMTYEDFVFQCFLKWRDLAQDPSTRPSHILYREEDHVAVIAFKAVKPLLSLEWGKSSYANYKWHYGRIDGLGQGYDAGNLCGATREVNALILLALAFQDEEAVKVLEFFRAIDDDPHLKFAYLTSERFPASLDKNLPPWNQSML